MRRRASCLQALRKPKNRSQSGAALLLVLFLGTLLSTVLLAFLGASEQRLKSAARETASLNSQRAIRYVASLLTRDLQSEIRENSYPLPLPPPSLLPFYAPTPPPAHPPLHPVNPGKILPSMVTNSSTPPQNLLKQSCSNIPTTSKSSNGRFITPERWNLSALLPRKYPKSASDFTPLSSGILSLGKNSTFWEWNPPDWILLNRNGHRFHEWSPSNRWSLDEAAVQTRFAYQIFDLGGLLDLNVAGHSPKACPQVIASKKGGAMFADLQKTGLNPEQILSLVEWRNPETLRAPDLPPFHNPFLNLLYNGSLNRGFLAVPRSLSKQTHSDRGLGSRRHLIERILSLGTRPSEKAALANTLRFFTHFSRSLEQPSYTPGPWDSKKQMPLRPEIVPPLPSAAMPTAALGTQAKPPFALEEERYRGGNDEAGHDYQINPPFLSVRVLKPFQRFDGSTAIAREEPLVKTRFPLTRLTWITPEGPAASLPRKHPRHDPDGTPTNILKCFGLTWSLKNEEWIYDHSLHAPIGSPRNVLIGTLIDVQTLGREPDFFELLKASISAGSLGKAAAITPSHIPLPERAQHSPGSFHQKRDCSVDLQILQIGANLIDQYDSDSFPTRIAIQHNHQDSPLPSTPPVRISGIEDLPYFHRLHFRAVPEMEDAPNPVPEICYPTEITDRLPEFKNHHCGSTSILALPELWNPHAANEGTLKTETPTRFRCIAVSEDPEGACRIGSTAWKKDKRFQLRPATAFAATADGSPDARVFFGNRWPLPGQPPSISNLDASTHGFWVDIFSRLWTPSLSGPGPYAVQCYPFYKLPSDAHPISMPSSPSQSLHVDRFSRNHTSPAVGPRYFALAEQTQPSIALLEENAEVEIRGSELLFEIPSASLFREPTTLCRPNLPLGSNLRAGPSHWLNSPDFSGSRDGAFHERASAPGEEKWLGFPLGERPSSWLMAAKLIDHNGQDVPADSFGWDPKLGPRQFTRYLGGNPSAASDSQLPGSVIRGTGTGWYSPDLLEERPPSLWRFFRIVSNTASIEPTQLTLRLQYLSKKGTWVTYDERYLALEGECLIRFDFRNTPEDPRGSGRNWQPTDNHQRLSPIPWQILPYKTASGKTSTELPIGRPVILSLDPRSTRFGHPVAPSFSGFSFHGALPQWKESHPDSRWVDSEPSPAGEPVPSPQSSVGPIQLTAATNQPQNSPPRQTASLFVPGSANGPTPDPKLIGWFPNTVWDPPARVLFNPGNDPSALLPPNPPSLEGCSWRWGGQSANPHLFRPGWLCQNIPSPATQYWADPDDIVRRATGGLSSLIASPPAKPSRTARSAGIPTLQSPNNQNAENRPIILNRPFRSVAEMGYAFRGAPWKHIDFSSPESADAALLDVFSASDSPELVAGKINPNSAPIEVLAALLSGGLKDELATDRVLSQSATGEAVEAATQIVESLHSTNWGEGPLQNISEWVSRPLGKVASQADMPPMEKGFYSHTIPFNRPSAGTWAFKGLAAQISGALKNQSEREVQRLRESIIRSLADSTQVRVWNLMLDVIVQTGKYPAAATQGSDFVVESETHAWICLAIDRLTGTILDQSEEWLSE